MTRLLIIGAGPAGMRAAEVLRQHSAEAEITLIGDELHLPYDRPPLSKAFLTNKLDAEKLYLKPESFFAEHGIRLRLGQTATAIDRAAKTVTLADGTQLSYDKLLIATGCRARRLPAALETVPIHYLRSLGDADRLRAALIPGAAIVMIGGGFIGLEIAASARKLGAEVTVLEALPRLMARAVPEMVSAAVRRLHESHGVRFEFGARLQSIAPAPGGGARIATGRGSYRADSVIAGIGAAPNAELAEAAGLAVDDGILVDACGRTGDADIFAAGDVTRHENPLLGRPIRVESWQVALNHAAVVARAMLGPCDAYAELPWLWTDQYDTNIQALGFFGHGQDLVTRGDPASAAFTLLGLDRQGRIEAALTFNNGRDMSALKRLAVSRASLPRDALADPARKLAELLKLTRTPTPSTPHPIPPPQGGRG
jgi:anthranilate 1,2-dioxygenase ferredoxin reductase subunit